MDTAAELSALTSERERLLRDGLTGSATIVGISENVGQTALGAWHELILDVELPHREPYRATRRIALELATAPHITAGAKVPVRVDPMDRSKVLPIVTL